MHSRSIAPAANGRPRKGIRAEVIVDGLSPAPARQTFELESRYSILAAYLLDNGRGFTEMAPRRPDDKITLFSLPEGIDQHRVAFGLTLLMDAQRLSARMGLKLHMPGLSVGRFIRPSEPGSCIRLLEAIEGVDSLEVKFRYLKPFSSAYVKGTLSL